MIAVSSASSWEAVSVLQNVPSMLEEPRQLHNVLWEFVPQGLRDPLAIQDNSLIPGRCFTVH